MKPRIVQKEVLHGEVRSDGAVFRLFDLDIEVDFGRGKAVRFALADIAAEARRSFNGSDAIPHTYTPPPPPPPRPAPAATAPADRVEKRAYRRWLNIEALGKAISEDLKRKAPLSGSAVRDIILRHDTAPGVAPLEYKAGERGGKLYPSDYVPMLAQEYKAFWADLCKRMSKMGKERYARGEVKGLIPNVKGGRMTGAAGKIGPRDGIVRA